MRQHRQKRFVSLRDKLINLGPAVKPRGDKGNGREPRGDKGKVSLRDELINLGPAVKPRGDKWMESGHRGDKRMPAAQWVPACAGMTADGVRGDKGKCLRRNGSRPAPG